LRVTSLEIDTTGQVITDLTSELVSFCSGQGDGLAHAFCPHATAALVLMELGAGSDLDLLSWLDRVLPRTDSYRHQHGGRGHGADHLLPALLGASVTIPVAEGRPRLGTWQSLALIDTNGDNNRRQVLLSFLGA